MKVQDWREYLDEDRPPTELEKWEQRELRRERKEEDRVRPDRLLAS